MKKIRAAIVGYGNIGHFVLDALQVAPDFEIAGIVRRRVSEVPMELSAYPVVSSLDELKDVDVAILCTPTREVEHFAIKALERVYEPWIVSTFTHRYAICAKRSMQQRKNTIRSLLYRRVGIPERIRSCEPLWRLVPLKVSRILISVPV